MDNEAIVMSILDIVKVELDSCHVVAKTIPLGRGDMPEGSPFGHISSQALLEETARTLGVAMWLLARRNRRMRSAPPGVPEE
jgi:hypothetical protein